MKCEVCDKPIGRGGCTNGRCSECHRAYCTPGGDTSPGHGRGKPSGFYVLTYGGGRYTSVAWCPTREQAEAEVARIKLLGAWSGMPPKIEESQS